MNKFFFKKAFSVINHQSKLPSVNEIWFKVIQALNSSRPIPASAQVHPLALQGWSLRKSVLQGFLGLHCIQEHFISHLTDTI